MARTRNIDFDEGADSRRFVTALARGLDVLACFQVDEKWLTNAEIAARTGLPKPTVVRLAYTLCVLGYLRHSRDSGKYALGDSLAALGITMVSNLRLRRIARPYMQDFADRYDISVSLGIRNGLSVLYVENCRSGTPLSLGLDLGARLPVAETAMGHALLAVMEPRER
ncbi:helix-turn-helix domain-containing protein, partial [Diaphorobacter sp.]